MTWLLRAAFVALVWTLTLPAYAGPQDGLAKPANLVDRTTPRRAFEGLMAACRAADFALAAHYLHLGGVPRKDQAAQGPVLAQRLCYVVERKLPAETSGISDALDGGVPPQVGLVTAGFVALQDEPVAVTFARVRFDDGVSRWLVSRQTVSLVPQFWALHGARGFEDRLPEVLVTTRVLGVEAWQWLALGLAMLVAALLGFTLGSFLHFIVRRVVRWTASPWDDQLADAARGPVRLILALAALSWLDDPLRFTPAMQHMVERLTFPVLVVGLAWLTSSLVSVAVAWMRSRLPEEGAALESRGVLTQLAVMERVGNVVIAIVASAIVLMQFQLVRSVGLSLLASAGLLGVIFGFAAQKSLAGVVAGIQLSITQPIRIGDTVVFEGELGTIEVINLTYVVVKTWDERRLIVPIGRFLETPFQNWTRLGDELSGPVLVPVDYATPVEQVRAELGRICKDEGLWDGRTCELVVVEITDKALVLRVTVSAKNADDTFYLRCKVRERLMAWFVNLEGGRYLTQVRGRTIVDPPPPPPSEQKA